MHWALTDLVSVCWISTACKPREEWNGEDKLCKALVPGIALSSTSKEWRHRQNTLDNHEDNKINYKKRQKKIIMAGSNQEDFTHMETLSGRVERWTWSNQEDMGKPHQKSAGLNHDVVEYLCTL